MTNLVISYARRGAKGYDGQFERQEETNCEYATKHGYKIVKFFREVGTYAYPQKENKKKISRKAAEFCVENGIKIILVESQMRLQFSDDETEGIIKENKIRQVTTSSSSRKIEQEFSNSLEKTFRSHFLEYPEILLEGATSFELVALDKILKRRMENEK